MNQDQIPLHRAQPLPSALPTPSANNASFIYDAILTDFANTPIYATGAHAHVQASLDGYNAVIFAYGQ